MFHFAYRLVVVVPPERHPVISGIKQSAYYPGTGLTGYKLFLNTVKSLLSMVDNEVLTKDSFVKFWKIKHKNSIFELIGHEPKLLNEARSSRNLNLKK
jgi:hypothetical protein